MNERVGNQKIKCFASFHFLYAFPGRNAFPSSAAFRILANNKMLNKSRTRNRQFIEFLSYQRLLLLIVIKISKIITLLKAFLIDNLFILVVALLAKVEKISKFHLLSASTAMSNIRCFQKLSLTYIL